MDLAHAYQTFATGGLLVTGSLGAGARGPVGIRRVTLRDHPDRVRGRNKPRRRRVLPKAVAQETTNILESVIKVGTAKVAQLGKVRAWGKTGTTENYGDAWFVGATDKLTVAVWVGYPNGLKPMLTEYRGEPVAGGTYPAQIWHDFMLGALTIEKTRLERACARETAASKPKDTPSKRCIEAGLAQDPNAVVTPPATTPLNGTTTTGTDGATTTPKDGGTPAGGTGAATTPATPAPVPQTPAVPPTAQPTPATPAVPPAPPDSGGATPTPTPPPPP
jgi:penicillin-binding protein 1A